MINKKSPQYIEHLERTPLTLEEVIDKLIDFWTLDELTTPGLIAQLRSILPEHEVINILLSIGVEV